MSFDDEAWLTDALTEAVADEFPSPFLRDRVAREVNRQPYAKWRGRPLGVALIAAAVAAAVVALLALPHALPSHRVNVAGGPSPVAPARTTVPVTITQTEPTRRPPPTSGATPSSPAPTSAAVAAGSVGPASSTPVSTTAPPPPTTLRSPPPTTSPPSAVSGVVRDGSGQPVANAYVIGLNSLTVARTDTSGRFSMPCSSAEPLVAATWLLPVESGGSRYGQTTTMFGPPPTTPGLGYSFSGGASDAQQAAAVACGTQSTNFVLAGGANVRIRILDSSGAPLVTKSGIPPDNLYLPGLGDHAALETAPVTADGFQRIDQIGPGVLHIDGTNTFLSCTGPGVSPDQSIAGATVTVTSGATIDVVCHDTL